MWKDFSAVCCCWLCHSQDPAVPRVSWPVLLKSPADSTWTASVHTDSAVVRGQQHAGHRLDCSSETPTESNLAYDNFFFFFFADVSWERRSGSATCHMTPESQEQLLLFTVLAVITGSFVFRRTLFKARQWHCDRYPPTPHQRAAWLSALSSPSSSFLSSHFGCDCSRSGRNPIWYLLYINLILKLG